MATKSSRVVSGRLGTGSLVGAFVVAQLIAFAIAYSVDRPTFYAVFAVGTAVAAAYAADEGPFAIGAVALGSVLLVAIGMPLALFVARQDPSVVVEKAQSTPVHRALYLGVYAPLLAAVASLLFGVPLAWVLADGFPGQAIVESLVDLPLVVPHSVVGVIVLFGFGEGGAFPQLDILGTMVGMTIALTFVSAPYAVNASREAFEAIDDRLEYAARIHGASSIETFRRVTGPLAARGILTGGVLAWARSVSEFGAIAIVAYSVTFAYPLPFVGEETRAYHAPVFVHKTYLSGGLAESGAVSFLLLAVAAVLFLLIRWFVYDDSTSTGGGLP